MGDDPLSRATIPAMKVREAIRLIEPERRASCRLERIGL